MAGSGEAGIQTGTVKALAIISSSSSSSGDNNLRGFLRFLQDSSTGVTDVEGRIAGLTPGIHGLHIPAFGDTTNGCSSTGSYFHPLNKSHGALSDQNRHACDLGNIIANPHGIAEVSIKDEHIPLTGPHSVMGRAVVVDADADDLGRGANEFSRGTGNAGGRVGCGIIRLQ